MHPTQLPASPSYFDTKRRDLAANAYLAALQAQRTAQRERTLLLCLFYAAGLAAIAYGITLSDASPIAALLCFCLGAIALYVSIVPPSAPLN